MDDVVGEASECALSAREEDFDLVGGRVLLDAFENVGGLVISEHSSQQSASPLGTQQIPASLQAPVEKTTPD
jgi:hypothetical protein